MMNKTEMISTAKDLINEYTVREFGDNADFSNLTHIAIAYTTDEKLEFPIQIYVDLERMELVKNYDNNSKYDIRTYFGESQGKMFSVLGNLNFDELVGVSDILRNEIENDNALDLTEKSGRSL